MVTILTKGGNALITRTSAGTDFQKVAFACGWDANDGRGSDFDLDLVIAALGRDGKVPHKNWFVYYGNKQAPKHAISHSGDNLTGEGRGDDETVVFDFAAIPDEITRLIVAVNIYRARQRRQTFGMVSKAFVRAYDQKSGEEITRYNLTDDFGRDTIAVFGELRRESDGWRFFSASRSYTTQDEFREAYGIARAF